MLTQAEREELDAKQAFADLLGLTEMPDADFDRYIELLRKLRDVPVLGRCPNGR